MTAVVFDYAGVMGASLTSSLAARIETDLGIATEKTRRAWTRHNQEHDRGTMPEKEFWTHFRQNLNIPNAYPIESVFTGMVNLHPGMLELARKLKAKGYLTGLLSNICPAFGRKIERINELAFLDVRVLSYTVGEVKPESVKESYAPEELRIYTLLEERLREKGFSGQRSSIAFIDDSEGPVRSAAQYGLTAIKFDGDMEKLTDALREKGVRV